MIINKEKLFERIDDYQFEQSRDIETHKKISHLEKAVDNSLKEICGEILKTNGEVHLAYSGGVDSSLILVKLLDILPEKTLHADTIAKRCTHPDIEYAKKFVAKLRKNGKKFYHNIYLSDISSRDIKESNKILKTKEEKPDNYYMLMKLVSEKTNIIICCDIIDELMGGYYAHSKNSRLSTFKEFMSKLIPEHLEILDRVSSYFGVEVFLPYGFKDVMNCASRFNLNEMVEKDKRKKPIYELAKRNGVPQNILERKKYGLVSAFD